MTTDIGPGETVLALMLPISVDAFGLIPEFVDRVYGTGESKLRMDGNHIRITAPDDGFGPRTMGNLPDLVDADSLEVRSCNVADDTFQWTLEGSRRQLEVFVDSQLRMMDALGAVNYVVSDIAIGDAEPAFQVVVQRKRGLTQHEARTAAEDREGELRKVIAEAAAALGTGDEDAALRILLDAQP